MFSKIYIYNKKTYLHIIMKESSLKGSKLLQIKRLQHHKKKCR
jgi:hypothetical protein